MENTKNLFPAVMKGTAAVSAVLTLAFWLLDRLQPRSWLLPAVLTAATTCYHFSMRLLVGLVVPKLFANADPNRGWFRAKPFEEKLYAFLRIKRWKKYVPTYAPDTFCMDRPLREIARTMCISELVHCFIVPLSFVPLLLAIPFGELAVFLSTSLIAAGIDCVFVLLQRYNRPRVLRLLARRRPDNE